MTVYVVTITDKYGHDVKTHIFTNQAKADHWLEEYVRDNWAEKRNDEVPADALEAREEYFSMEWSHDEILTVGECVVEG